MKIDGFEFFINSFYSGNEIDLSFVTTLLARKFSMLDKVAISALNKCYALNEDINLVFGSTQGQFDRLQKLTRQFLTDNEVSPMGFSASVHNNTIGVFSLLKENNSPYTAISAGNHTVSATLCEAISQLAEVDSVLLCCADYFGEQNIAAALKLSKFPDENAIKVQFKSVSQNVFGDEYAFLNEFLNGGKVFDANYFRLEKIDD